MEYDDNVQSDTTAAIVMSSEVPPPVENIDITLSTPTELPTAPTRAPHKARALKPELRRVISQGSLDRFVVRDSSLKRKPSGDATVSPTSGHVAKAIRANYENDVS